MEQFVLKHFPPLLQNYVIKKTIKNGKYQLTIDRNALEKNQILKQVKNIIEP